MMRRCRAGSPNPASADRLSALLRRQVKPDGSRPRWVHLVEALRSGPKTTGQLGYTRGIGENVRGIRREADGRLRSIGFTIRSEETVEVDARGNRIANATYRLVDLRLLPHLERTDRVIEQLKVGAHGNAPTGDRQMKLGV